MYTQKYVLKNVNSFEPKDIFECGQCFRWNKQDDGSYTGVFGNNILNVTKINNDIIFKGITQEKIDDVVYNYFDLGRDYEKIKSKLSKIDKNMEKSIKYGSGIRLLNQDLWETIMSFIISANNNIPRIKGIIERLSKKYGNVLECDGKNYYTFPSPMQLKDVSVSDYRELGTGFRDIRLYQTTKMILNNDVDLDALRNNPNTNEVRDELLKLPGVGPKVADCILLFSDLKRLEVFPIDVWVRRVMNELYIKSDEESKVSRKQIEKIARDKFGDLAGVAQQFLFYYRREINE